MTPCLPFAFTRRALYFSLFKWGCLPCDRFVQRQKFVAANLTLREKLWGADGIATAFRSHVLTRIDPGTATASFETELPDFKWKIAKKVANKADFPAIFLFRIGYPEYIRISA